MHELKPLLQRIQRWDLRRSPACCGLFFFRWRSPLYGVSSRASRLVAHQRLFKVSDSPKAVHMAVYFIFPVLHLVSTLNPR